MNWAKRFGAVILSSLMLGIVIGVSNYILNISNSYATPSLEGRMFFIFSIPVFIWIAIPTSLFGDWLVNRIYNVKQNYFIEVAYYFLVGLGISLALSNGNLGHKPETVSIVFFCSLLYFNIYYFLRKRERKILTYKP